MKVSIRIQNSSEVKTLKTETCSKFEPKRHATSHALLL